MSVESTIWQVSLEPRNSQRISHGSSATQALAAPPTLAMSRWHAVGETLGAGVGAGVGLTDGDGVGEIEGAGVGASGY